MSIFIGIIIGLVLYVFYLSPRQAKVNQDRIMLAEHLRHLRDMNWVNWNDKEEYGTVVFDGEKYTREKNGKFINVTNMDGKFLRRFGCSQKELGVGIEIIKNEALVYGKKFIKVYALNGDFKRRIKRTGLNTPVSMKDILRYIK